MQQPRKNHSIYDKDKGIIFGSLTKGTDLMEGIIHEFEKYDVKAGEVTFIGSVANVGYVYPDEHPDGSPRYSDLQSLEGPYEILNGTGFLCEDEEGKTDLHLHALFIGKAGTVLGGHMIVGENPTYVTVEFTIHVSEKIQAKRTFNQELGFPTINFTERK